MDSGMDRLIELAPPPRFPIGAGSPACWEEVESRLGTKLPGDYKRVINLYGRGEFGDQFWVLSPFVPPPDDLLSQGEALLESYREGDSEDCPYPIYPEPGGVLPMGAI